MAWKRWKINRINWKKEENPKDIYASPGFFYFCLNCFGEFHTYKIKFITTFYAKKKMRLFSVFLFATSLFVDTINQSIN